LWDDFPDVPTLILGGWYDSYTRSTCKNYAGLAARKQGPVRMLMGPWTHGGWSVSNAGDVDFGTPAVPGEERARRVSLTVDGHRVTVPEGTSIMRAATQVGIPVPKLCATDSLQAFGSCRLCLVEIEGRRGLHASCTEPVQEGMAVQTQNDHIADIICYTAREILCTFHATPLSVVRGGPHHRAGLAHYALPHNRRARAKARTTGAQFGF